jgi:signal transduction histidine kinase
MNKRIKTLLAESGLRAYFTAQEAQIERFAELIVQDSIRTVQDRYMGDNNREDQEVKRCLADLRKNFGVD